MRCKGSTASAGCPESRATSASANKSATGADSDSEAIPTRPSTAYAGSFLPSAAKRRQVSLGLGAGKEGAGEDPIAGVDATFFCGAGCGGSSRIGSEAVVSSVDGLRVVPALGRTGNVAVGAG